MKKFIFILVALAFMACEKTIFVGGTVTDHQSGDSIEGLDMGLYAASPEFDYENKKWSDLELIARGTTNNDGFFSMEIDAETNMSHYIFYFPLPTIDTLSANAKYRYSSSYETDFLTPDYSKESEFRLERSSSIQVKLINFTQEQIEMRFADGAVRIHSLNYLANLSYKKLLAGQKYIFDFFEVVDFENQKEQLNYLGSTSHFIKTQLPEDGDKVEWFMPWQIIEIDYNTLERRLLD